MKTIKLLSAFLISTVLMTSCIAEVYVEEDVFVDSSNAIALEELLMDYEIWYVDIERTTGQGEIPFFQKAFTVSFRYGNFYANNNLVGIGSNGNGFGLDVGFYNAIGMNLDISHDLDGFYSLEVTQRGPNEIRVYHRATNTSYYLIGYQRSTFDYDLVFYDNIHYFLHEYEAWEKTYTSNIGAINEFDNENFLQFLYYGSGDNFRSSEDQVGTPISQLFFDYQGHYAVSDLSNNLYRKILTLDYDYLGNDFFELTVINDRTIELFHPDSGTTYEFRGRGYIQFKNGKQGKTAQNNKKRIKKADFLKLDKDI